MIRGKGLDLGKICFGNIETSEIIEFDGKIETIDCTTNEKEENETKEFPSEINFSMNLVGEQVKNIYYELHGKYVEKFIKDCYEGKYSYQEIVYLLKNGKIQQEKKMEFLGAFMGAFAGVFAAFLLLEVLLENN